MEKLSKESFKGIEYIRLQSLPMVQASLLKAWLQPKCVINIQVGEDILRDCVLFRYYDEWFNTLAITPVDAHQSISKPTEATPVTPSTYSKVAMSS